MSSFLINQKSSSSNSSRASSVASSVDSLSANRTGRREKQVGAVVNTGFTYDTIREKVLAKMKTDKNGCVVGNASVKALVDMFDACHKEGYDTRHFVPMLRQVCHLVATGAKIPELYEEVSVDNGLVILSESERATYDNKRSAIVDAVVASTGLSPRDKILEFGRADKSGNKQTYSPFDLVETVLSGLEKNVSLKANRHGPTKLTGVLSDAVRGSGVRATEYSYAALACIFKKALKNAGNTRLSISKDSNRAAFDHITQYRKRNKKDSSTSSEGKKTMDTLTYTVISSSSTAPQFVKTLYNHLKNTRGEAFEKLHTQSANTMKELPIGLVNVNPSDFVFNVVAEDRIALALARPDKNAPDATLSVDSFVTSMQICLDFASGKVIRDKEKQLAAKEAQKKPRNMTTGSLSPPQPRSSTIGSQPDTDKGASEGGATNQVRKTGGIMLMGNNNNRNKSKSPSPDGP